jgi:hypothetical protein
MTVGGHAAGDDGDGAKSEPRGMGLLRRGVEVEAER